jgi:hypothetical protein
MNIMKAAIILRAEAFWKIADQERRDKMEKLLEEVRRQIDEACIEARRDDKDKKKRRT